MTSSGTPSDADNADRGATDRAVTELGPAGKTWRDQLPQRAVPMARRTVRTVRRRAAVSWDNRRARATGRRANQETASGPTAEGGDDTGLGGPRPGKPSRIRLGLATVTERLMEQAPRIPVRDLATLRAQFPGLDAERLADKLIAGASKGSATVGAGIGAVAALPVPPAMTVELATETLGVAAMEIKLIAELHEVYGLRAPGNARQRAYAYVGAWANRRGVDVLKQGGITSALSGQLKRELRQRLLKRTVRNLPTLAPFLVGAAIGAVSNRRDTRRLAERIRGDLRARAVPWEHLEPNRLAPPSDGLRRLSRTSPRQPPSPPLSR